LKQAELLLGHFDIVAQPETERAQPFARGLQRYAEEAALPLIHVVHHGAHRRAGFDHFGDQHASR